MELGKDLKYGESKRIGRGFTAKVVRPISGDPLSVLREITKTSPPAFERQIAECVEVSRMALRNHGLPNCAGVRYRPNAPHDWQADDGTGGISPDWSFAELQHYVHRVRGLNHDSFEGLSATIVRCADMMQEADGPLRLEYALRLGFAWATLCSYSFSERSGRRSRVGSAKRGEGFRKAFSRKWRDAGLTAEMSGRAALSLLKSKEDLDIYVTDRVPGFLGKSRVAVETEQGVESMSIEYFRKEYKRLTVPN